MNFSVDKMIKNNSHVYSILCMKTKFNLFHPSNPMRRNISVDGKWIMNRRIMSTFPQSQKSLSCNNTHFASEWEFECKSGLLRNSTEETAEPSCITWGTNTHRFNSQGYFHTYVHHLAPAGQEWWVCMNGGNPQIINKLVSLRVLQFILKDTFHLVST